MKNVIIVFIVSFFVLNLTAQSVEVLDDGSLDVSGQVIRSVSYVNGDSGSGIDNGDVPGRTITYNKKFSDTKLRISYTDNFRVIGSNACKWEIKVNGSSCTSPGLAHSLYTQSGYSHSTSTLVGYCAQTATGNIPAGNVVITVFVSSAPGYSGADCYTGWNSTWMLEVEEVN